LAARLNRNCFQVELCKFEISDMKLPIPWILIAVFISLSLFYYFNQKTRIRRDERRDRLKEKHQEYLDSLLNNLKDKDSNNQEEVTN
jgi:hypothetical protein